MLARSLENALFEKVLCDGCKFENILQNAFVAANFVMILVSIRMYTKCWNLENISCFESAWRVFENMFVLKMSK